ncbi:MAG: MurR/RpiR family transcriptional regulator [Mesorhizobium sp.]|uniref:MurR/RpiR family transcriptional regulator n=1 Tax=unclassified Mesorhizobium TaxID=325217 RepID=UPI000FCAA77C|nr:MULTISPECIES: MurR/RpiR family transcriptional regulator [unclassified Mesorhizobium]RUV77384.1 MurR/RpiR family transcriptional regulator [Mesorhizobium sp. M5C.F.Cr.IN.023.01.1.1]RWI43919.1 MAG: MurR/RpiR family transcriptional regulator [Mesorhizobium sp.]RWJ27796.1 MAG: MurR/RpiR family transcriptional regulator [Mesorhizobium sp.]RWJ92657.1 MAG: MurR/RpiR family transcriptional regulator [Mesorhizobium sp.]RWL10425.1 MAG: MurR/RpiR family transcriptional regulator [Mesorhizobium sp.]
MSVNSPAMKAASHESILARLQDDIDRLPNALARIAKYILENPEKVLHQSVAELGEFAASGEASILRLCRQIGFSGFRDFKLALAAEIGRPGLPPTAAGTADSALQSLHDTMAQNLSIAHNNADSETLAKVAAALAASRRIDLYGAGMSGITAELLAYRLLRVGLTAFAFRNPNMAHEVASGLSPGCVAIGLSISGLTVDTVQFLKGARSAGALTVAITNRARSPLEKAADFTLQASGLQDHPIGGTLTSTIGKIFVIESLMLALGKAMDKPVAK